MPAAAETIRRSDWSLSLLAVVVTTIAFAPFALLDVDAHHDGVMLKPALDVLAGQVVFRDTFSQYGIGLHYMQAALLWAFGATLPVMRATAVGIYALTAGVLVGSWRLLMSRGLVVLALLVWLALPGFYQALFSLQAWSSVYALPFQALVLWSLLRALLGRNPTANGFISGIACGLTFSCRQPVGAATSIAAVAAYGWAGWASDERRPPLRALAGCLAGLALVLALLLGVLLVGGSFRQWYLQTVDWPRHWAFSGSEPVWKHVLARLVPMPAGTLPWLAVAVVALVPLGRVSRRMGDRRGWPAIGSYALLSPRSARSPYDSTRRICFESYGYGRESPSLFYCSERSASQLL
jgi:hypothetical protein